MPRPNGRNLLCAVNSGDTTALVATTIGAVLAPEFALPALVLELGALFLYPEKLNAYLSLSNNFLGAINNLLEMIIKLDQIGIIDLDTDCCSILRKGLIYVDEDDNEVGLATILFKALNTVRVEEGEDDVPLTHAQLLEEMGRGFYFKLADGQKFSLGESLGRLLMTGYMHPSQG